MSEDAPDDMANAHDAPPQISKLVDELEGTSAFHYGANAQSLGETTASITTTSGDTHHFDKVHVVAFEHTDTDWVFGVRAVRSTEVPSVGVLKPRRIFPADTVAAIEIHPAPGSNEAAHLTALPSDTDGDTNTDSTSTSTTTNSQPATNDDEHRH